MLTASILAALVVAFVLLALYLTVSAIDWHSNAAILPTDHQPTFWQHVATDLAARRYAWTQKQARRIRTWARAWWWLVVTAIGMIGCAKYIGGTDYLLSWGGTGFRAVSGAVLGYLVIRFLLRIDVSAIAEKYPYGSQAQADAAGKAVVGTCIVVAAAILAMANGV